MRREKGHNRKRYNFWKESERTLLYSNWYYYGYNAYQKAVELAQKHKCSIYYERDPLSGKKKFRTQKVVYKEQ